MAKKHYFNDQNNEFIPYGKQSIDDKDIDAVISVLKSDFLTQGPVIQRFEESFCEYTGAKFSLAVCNATAALHVACLALKVTSGDIVWTSPNSFIASANCARFCGADVDFVDIDETSYNLCPVKLEQKLAKAKRDGKLPKVVIPVHFAGQPCDMAKIFELSKIYGFAIIEDASHAVGAQYQDQLIGSCEFSDICIFSFHPVKIITSGEGGLALTNSPELDKSMRSFACHAIERTTEDLIDQEQGEWYYEQQALGFNYRMTELQAALGLSQLEKVTSFVKKRHQLFEQYNYLLKDLDIHLPHIFDNSYSSVHLYPIRLSKRLVPYKKWIFSTLRRLGIGVQTHYIPIHTQPYYKSLGFSWGDFPVAESYYQSSISLPMYSDLTLHQQTHITQVLEQILEQVNSESKGAI